MTDVPGERNAGAAPAVRAIAASDEAVWRRLWAGYTAFYETVVPDAITDATWRRLLDPASPLLGRIAEIGGQAAGFSASVLHDGTWTAGPLCYLEDLFVDPRARGAGAGGALIQDLIDLGRARGWSRLYWHTRAGNAAARRLYDKFTPADDFVRYRLFLE
jgi:ribosomal protein S18 acetylase RimI-like enzyme